MWKFSRFFISCPHSAELRGAPIDTAIYCLHLFVRRGCPSCEAKTSDYISKPVSKYSFSYINL